MAYWLKRIFNPEIFQGKYRRDNYFEGWYFKIIDHDCEHALAVIPGISYAKGGVDSHAFIQVLDARNQRVDYHRYAISEFSFNEEKFEVSIGKNYFSDEMLKLDVGEGASRIVGELYFNNRIKYPKTLRKPGIMGPYTFIPRMECYHGIVNIHHEISGTLQISGLSVNFGGGYGYIEKDWGTSFPEAWIWLQSNHFTSENVSIMFSLAKIPWLGSFFWGFLSFLRINDRIYNFATYSKAHIIQMDYQSNRLQVSLQDKQYRLDIDATQAPGGILKAPKNGLMGRDILESINAEVLVKLSDRSANIIYEGKGSHTGLEVVSDIATYFEEFPIKSGKRK